MTNIGKWNSPRAVQSVMGTELNSLASGSMATSAAAYDNTSNLDIYVDIEVLLAAFSPVTTTPPYVTLFVQESVDGTNFPAQSAADMRLTSSQLLVTIPIGEAASTAQRVVARQVQIPPAKFNVLLDNQTGTTFAASGNTVRFLPYNLNLNG